MITLIKYYSPLIIFFLLFSCGPSESEIAEQKHQLEERDERIIDSLNNLNFYHFKDISDSLMLKDQKHGAAIAMYGYIHFAKQNKGQLADSLARLYISMHLYEEAILAYYIAVLEQFNLKNVYFERAKCFEKVKERALAVRDLKNAIKLGNEDADKLHNKINPEKRKITGYVTRCCDGTTSNASGRGACSRHGGVCNWNEPVYKTYRLYE